MVPNIIKYKVRLSLYLREEKTLKDTRDIESITRINCRKRGAVVVDQVCAVGCAVGWLLFRRYQYGRLTVNSLQNNIEITTVSLYSLVDLK